jgi:hypothetical protein
MFKKFKDNNQGPSYSEKYRKVIGRISYSIGKFFIFPFWGHFQLSWSRSDLVDIEQDLIEA